MSCATLEWSNREGSELPRFARRSVLWPPAVMSSADLDNPD
ncbi:hypothetical protein MILUP08_40843 [Micromonospora lupini str. Lupac 08]|uniref:Uncharacterized protein n=1 Tax=Micromonospora lupini str. Lupac 08 TaxID=1150864 RepID=I0KWI5_9ACTN|nr:hypothetical protein MILUP08_40843 [Micromonospora lupini str. Lupac 08]